MFVIIISYKKSLEIVDHYLADHAAYLDNCYDNNYFIVSGRRNPRTGGVIFSQLTDRKELEKLLINDPFHLQGIADYDIIEFTPSKYHENFKPFLSA